MVKFSKKPIIRFALIVLFMNLIIFSLSLCREWIVIRGCKKKIAIVSQIIEQRPEFQDIEIKAPFLGDRKILVTGFTESSEDSKQVIEIAKSFLESDGFEVDYSIYSVSPEICIDQE